MKATFLLFISLFIIVILQAQVSKTANVTPGGLSTVLSATELNTVTNLTLTGTIDARDFKTMRDDMPVLAVLDLNGVTIAFYSGNLGTASAYETSYPANVIPDYAFFNPSSEQEQGKISLTIVILPSSVTSIGSYAFLFCNGLTSVTIPASVISIGEAAFVGTTGLISVDENNLNYLSQNGALYNKTQTTLIQCSISTTGSFVIPSSVSSIGLGAFFNSKLTSVSIPSSVTSISNAAFRNCSALTSVFANSSYPVDLTSVEGVFFGVNKTTCTLNVPYGAKVFYAAASQWKDFKTIIEETQGFLLGSTNLKVAAAGGSSATVNITANVAWTSSSDQTWLTVDPTSGTGNKTITFTAEANSSVLSRSAKITFSATGFASQILTIKQEGQNKTINVTAGGLLSVLTGTELSGISNLTLTGTLDARDFKTLRDNMPSLAVLDLNGVTIAAYTGTEGTNGNYSYDYPANILPARAFFNIETNQGKTSLTIVNLPLSITSVESYAFYGCSGLTSITIPSMVTIIGYSAFQSCSSLTSVAIPSSVTSIGSSAFSCSGLISVEASNPNYSSLNGVLFNKDKTTLIQCPTSKTGSYTIPASVSLIESSAFSNCNNLTSVVIPSSVTSIGTSAFNNCSGLISVDAGNLNYSSTDGVLFNKNQTILIKCPVSKSGSYVIPSSVTTIGEIAFYNCSLLNSVTIPFSVTSIGNSAFEYCSGLNSITVNSSFPIDLKSNYDVFYGVSNTTCTLNVPYGAKGLYAAASQWKDFTNIIEAANGFTVSSISLKLTADEGSNAAVNITANVSWTVSSDQTWLTVNPTSGTGNKTLTFTAKENTSFATRTAKVTFSATDIPLQIITVTQAGFPKTINNTAGGLLSAMTANELNTISNLIVTGTIDARDFKTLRDNMPLLAELDISTATIAAYSGTDGTYYSYLAIDYPANSIPKMAFQRYYPGNTVLTSIILPSSITSIGENAFYYCKGLTSITIPPSVVSIDNSAFYNCSGLTSIYAKSSNPVDLTSSYYVFFGIDKAKCILTVPYASKARYSAANQWKDFTIIVEESQGFVFSPTFLKFSADGGSSATANITANVAWTATSDQTWLTVNPTSGTGDKTLTFTAEYNSTVGTRTAKVTFSATGVTSQSIAISQDGQPKIIDVKAGSLSSALTAAELDGINNLTVTGTIDARDFKTIRDYMPLLSVLNLSGATVVAYSGIEGTSGNSYTQAEYPANAVPDYAFYNQTTGKGKTSLTSVVLPVSINSIGVSAFFNCSGLTSVTIPSSVTSIGSSVFYGCSSLTSITIPSSLTSIESGVFYGCSGLTSISIPSSVTSIGSFAFSGCSGLTSVTIPPTVTIIGANAFDNCVNLASVSIPLLVTSIENWTFSGCKSLTSVTIPSSVTSIGSMAFGGCFGLTSVTIPSSVTFLGQGAFFNCIGLTTVTIPTSVNSISSRAFEYCFGITTINANSSHPVDLTSSPDVFSGINKTTCTLNVPYKSKALYAAANQWKDFTNINEETQGFLFDQSILNFLDPGGSVLINATANVTWTATSDQTWLTINPASGTGSQAVTFIATANETAAMRTAKVTVSATGITPQSITVNQKGQPKTIEITPGTLASKLTAAELNGNTNLTITGTMDARDFKTLRDKMPLLAVLDLSGVAIAAYTGTEGLTEYETIYPENEIPMFAFYNQNTSKGKISLISVKLPTSVSSIGSSAFQGCSGLTSISIPSSVTSISGGAFYDCSGLTSLTIPSSVTSIAGGAFMNCSGLTSIFANSSFPVNLIFSGNVFSGVNKTSCTLNVPYGSKALYIVANQWQDFTNIIENAKGLKLSSNALNIAASTGSTATVDLTGNIEWTASSDQTWLTINPASGTGNQTLTFTAEANPTAKIRKATVTVSATGIDSQMIIVTQEALPLIVTAGGLKTLFTADELATKTKLTLIGTIDARDFKTMRDDMPLLAEIDLSGVTIAEYTGTEGTLAGTTNIVYPANEVPVNAFWNLNTNVGKISLTAFIFPSTVTSIGYRSFQYLYNLTSIIIPSTITHVGTGAFYGCFNIALINIPSSVISIGDGAFFGCNYINVEIENPNYSSQDGILFNKTQTTLIQYPSSKTGNFIIPSSVISIGFAAFTNSSLTSITIPSSVISIGNWAFQQCSGLTSIYTNSSSPVDLTASYGVFSGIDKTICTLNVPYKAKGLYAAANQWKDFTTIVEMDIPDGLQDIAENSTQFKCYPNPFAGEITIEIQNPKRTKVSVDIYNLAGQKIRTLVNGNNDELINLIWNGTNDLGQQVALGIYICKMNNHSKQLIYRGQKGNK